MHVCHCRKDFERALYDKLDDVDLVLLTNITDSIVNAKIVNKDLILRLQVQIYL